MRGIAVVLFLMISQVGSAQTWAPFPLDATSEWRETLGYRNGDLCWSQYERNLRAGDTISFDGQQYITIRYTGVQWHEAIEGLSSPQTCNQPLASIIGIAGHVRTESGRYYLHDGSTETLVCDFNLELGDTLHLTEVSVVVDSIDAIVLNGHSLRRLFYEANPEGLLWSVEGIGHNLGFLQPVINFEGLAELMCYREYGTPLFPFEIDGCNILSASVSKAENHLGVSPNPSTGIFRVEPSEKTNYRIYDSFGKLVLEGQSNGSSEIDITNQPNGIYLLMVETEKGVSTTKLVKQ